MARKGMHVMGSAEECEVYDGLCVKPRTSSCVDVDPLSRGTEEDGSLGRGLRRLCAFGCDLALGVRAAGSTAHAKHLVFLALEARK